MIDQRPPSFGNNALKRMPAERDLEQLRQITKVARLYHLHGARQAAIAQQLNISQAGVSRLLRLAEEAGIVQTVVLAPEGLHPELEENLIRAYGLEHVVISDNPSRETEIPQVLGAAAARLFAKELQGQTLGFTSWSVTLREMARLLPLNNASNITHVVEMLGDLGSPMLQHEATLATLQLANSLGAEAVFLRTPGVTNSAQLRDAALGDAHVNRAMEYLDKVDVAFLGLGPANFHGPLEEHDNFFTSDQLAKVRKAGAAGQLHQRFITAEGAPLDTPLEKVVVGISLAQLRRVKKRVLVAGGPSKHTALLAALRGRWAHTLVTDLAAANFLMAATNPHPTPTGQPTSQDATG